MNRIQVNYGGRDYVIGNRSLDDVQSEIAAGIASGEAAWLEVNYGAGKPTSCHLLLTPGVAISLVEFVKPPAEDPDVQQGAGAG